MIRSRRSPFLAVLFSLGLLVAGGKGLLDARRQAKWVPAEARTTFATPASNGSFLDFLEGLDRRSRTRRTHGVRVGYTYLAGERERSGEYIFGKFTREEAAAEAGAFPTGGTVTVYLDPARPDRSVKERAGSGASLLMILLGGIGVAASPFLGLSGGGSESEPESFT